MSFNDDAADDSVGFRPPPHQDDRLWRHPSELRGARAPGVAPGPPEAATPTATPPPTHRPWGTLFVAASGMALIAAGVTIASFSQGGGSSQSPIRFAGGSLKSAVLPLEQAPIGTKDDDEDYAEMVAPMTPTLVRVDSGMTRGSGVVLREEGLVVTSDQIVGQQTSVTVSLSDGRLLTAETVGVDPVTGIAVLDLPGRGYPTPAVYDNERAPAVPSGFVVGVGETGRLIVGEGELDISPSGVDRFGIGRIDGVFALSSPAHALARGGPVIDGDARVLGILVWTDETTSYSLPIDVVNRVVDEIDETGAAQHSWLGIEGHDQVDENGARAGVYVASVLADGPTAGILQSGDVVVALDDQPVRGMPDLVLELRRHAPGSKISVTYERPLTRSTPTEDLVLTVRPPNV